MRCRSIAMPKPHAIMMIHERSVSGLRAGAYAYGDLSAATRPIAMRRRKAVRTGERRNWSSNSRWQRLHNLHSWRGSGTSSGSMRGMKLYHMRRSQIEQRMMLCFRDWWGLFLWRVTVGSPFRMIPLTACCPFCTLELNSSSKDHNHTTYTYYHILWWICDI